MTHYSKILRDKPPLETAIYWIEHVIKFGGAHLRPSVYELNFIQYYLLDVVLFVLGVATGMIILTVYLSRVFWQICVRKAEKHSKIA